MLEKLKGGTRLLLCDTGVFLSIASLLWPGTIKSNGKGVRYQRASQPKFLASKISLGIFCGDSVHYLENASRLINSLLVCRLRG